ncbi:heterokaryon incompatibility protein-domain-containing protein [Xylariaceae sp. FL1272]|nr:heterokaryon incompatibility protein-domain-containing protein [Xylariaceae sp. FL1272]
MRLINTKSYIITEFMGAGQAPPYAILSHCWNHDPDDGEITYLAFTKGVNDPDGLGWQKIKRFCSIARKAGFTWGWIDTCCIDKRSSAELSEAINSMFQWYSHSKVCYVFLDDVDLTEMPRFYASEYDHDLKWRTKLSTRHIAWAEKFIASRWFTRGWTLQELLAPRNVMFVSRRDSLLGTRRELAQFIATATRIHPRFLHGHLEVDHASIAQRMSWAASRTTTRIEDTAYCLLGLCGVNLPLFYGEGQKAFVRLQQEIIRLTDDASIFAWGPSVENQLCIETKKFYTGILAASPRAFMGRQEVLRLPPDARANRGPLLSYTSTNRGVAIYHHNIQPGFVGKLLRLANGAGQNHYGNVLIPLNCGIPQIRTFGMGSLPQGT